MEMAAAETLSISPFFIVSDLKRTIAFYGDLGFEVMFQEPAADPFFAILSRGGAMLFVKDVGEPALPNSRRHPWARWDAYIFAPDPNGLASAYATGGITFSVPLSYTQDGLCGFEIVDPDGYVLFCGRPR